MFVSKWRVERVCQQVEGRACLSGSVGSLF